MPNIERLTTLLEYVEKLPPEAINMEWHRYGEARSLIAHAIEAFPNRFRWSIPYSVQPEDISVGYEKYPGCHFFDLSKGQWKAIFSMRVKDEEAVSNLRNKIEVWSRCPTLND